MEKSKLALINENKRILRMARIYLIVVISLSTVTLVLAKVAVASEPEIEIVEKVVTEYVEVEVEDKEEIEKLGAEIEALKHENEELTAAIMSNNDSYLGEFEVTNYTLREEECGKAPDHPAYGITASGKRVSEGVTIASDWNVLPKGTKVYIEGFGVREVQDKGGLVKGKKIDVYVEDLKEALEFGRRNKKVWIIEWGE